MESRQIPPEPKTPFKNPALSKPQASGCTEIISVKANRIRFLGTPAAEWNDRQDTSQPWGTFILIGDEIKEVNGKTGSENMLQELNGSGPFVIHITRPSRRARAVLEATAGDAAEA